MESVHGIDVSWMSKQTSHNSNNNNAKDNASKAQTARTNSPALSEKESNDNVSPLKETTPTPAKPVQHRPSFSRSVSSERTTTLTLNGSKPTSPSPTISRRNSWLSSISSKFSSSPGVNPNTTPPTTPPATTAPPTGDSPVPAGPSAPRNAVLQHGVKGVGDAPYIPAPPKSPQPSFLQSAFRRLSSSGGQLSPAGKGISNGLCERRVLNVDRNRERCHISELDQSKLRRVAFCVDVEIASGPRYVDDADDDKKKEQKEQKKKLGEKGEGEALKRPEEVKQDKEQGGVLKATGEQLSNEPKKEESTTATELRDIPGSEKDNSKKKEKKKRSEEERKARKEKKRKLAEQNGTVPVELVRNESDSSLESSLATGAPKTQASPTTDPVRIYRRCCQLRETPILKRITEQLAASITDNSTPGVVNRLDLTGYWLQLPDLVTLGDYLAVVPVKELVMESCGLSDEGTRVLLAGLLAAKCPIYQRKKSNKAKGDPPQGGFVERLVLKGNVKIGRDGWRYISLFINMCRSLKYLDLSNIPFPQSLPATTPSPGSHTHHTHHTHHLHRSASTASTASEAACLLSKAIGERLAGPELELLNMAECGMTTEQLGGLLDGIIKSGLRRLGIAGNNITPEGMQHVARYLREGKCEGLDLGGNNLKEHLGAIADALDEHNNLYALSLADCSLTPDSLWTLFPALAKLKNFKFIDLSQNHDLFETQPSALSLLRRYLPKMLTLKRIHLTDVSMTPEQAIALAEIIPESPSLAHVNIMENPLLAALANAKNEANQEEACALYASLMAAVRVSQTIVCIDIEVPSTGSSEVVKALAKQVVAYCLFNMERGPVAEIHQAPTAPTEQHVGEKEVAVPDVLLHIVGHAESFQYNDDNEPAPDEDYVIGGTGVVKALGICLRNRGNDSRRPSADRTFSDLSDAGGSATPKHPVSGGKAKDMSKNLLGSARKIRARLQPALVKESKSGDRNNYQRLLFLDQTLEGMIKRFEDEFPETRLPEYNNSEPISDLAQSSPSENGIDLSASLEAHSSYIDPSHIESNLSDDEEGVRPVLSRHNSDVSLASRALSQEEGRMHRFGQQFRRDILKPESEDHTHGTTAFEQEPKHLQLLRATIEELGGDEIRKMCESYGQEALISELSNEASKLRKELIDIDPEAWQQFVHSQEAAQRNKQVGNSEVANTSAIE